MKEAGVVTAKTMVVDVTLSTDTNAYADGDLLADAQEIKNMIGDKGSGTITSVTVIDSDDQGAAMDIFFVDDSTSWGTENAAAGPADAQALNVLGAVSVEATDYVDLANSQIAYKNNQNIIVSSADSASIYVAAIARGAATYSADGLKLRIGFIQD